MVYSISNISYSDITTTSVRVNYTVDGVEDGVRFTLYLGPNQTGGLIPTIPAFVQTGSNGVGFADFAGLPPGTECFLSAINTTDFEPLVIPEPDSFTTLSDGPGEPQSVTDVVMDSLGGSGSLRDRQMAEHVAAGRITGSYMDRCIAAGTTPFPR